MLREDFCGTAALSRTWVAGGVGRDRLARAVAVDLDVDVLARARRSAHAEGITETDIAFRCLDAVGTLVDSDADACDVIFVGNFSIGYIHDRATLVEYLRRSRQRLTLNTSGRGVFACDTYSGPSAFTLGSVTRVHPAQGGQFIRYTWQQKHADALTGMVECVLHFQVEHDGDVIARFPDAFTYRWRLWSIPELREAMREAGFRCTEVYQDIAADPLVPMSNGRELSESGIVCIVARA